jgi:hypothetical protein
MINTKNSIVEKLDLNYLNFNNLDHHVINIKNPELYYKWLNKSMTIEEIIGSREFSIFRKPNIYNKDVLLIATTQI